MKIEDLEDYKYLKKEIEELEKRLKSGETENKEILELLQNRKEKLDSKLYEIESFIDSISESELRRIIYFKFIKGQTWEATATRIYGYPCGDRARKRLDNIILRDN